MALAIDDVPKINANTITAPGLDYAAITTSDTTNFNVYTRAIYVGVGGDVVAVNSHNVATTFKNVPTGAILPIMALRVNTTSTTATNLVAIY